MLSGSYNGFLEKRSRARGFLSNFANADGDTWQRREFRLDGQVLTYWKGNVKKGELNVENNVIRKLVPEEANGREFGFEVAMPRPNLADEKLYLAAETYVARAKWISVLNLAAKLENWTLRPKTLLKKTGQDVARALIAGPRDERQFMVAEYLMIGARKAHFRQRKDSLQEQLEKLAEEEREGKGNKYEIRLRSRDINEAFEKCLMEHASFVIQSFLRQSASRRRLGRTKHRDKCAVRFQRCIRAFLFRRRLQKRRRRRKAAHVIVSFFIWRLSVLHAKVRLQKQPLIIQVEEVRGKGVRFDQDVASHEFHFYVMSCFDGNTDPDTQFRGCQETRVEHGYSLRSTSVFRSEGIAFNTLPVWKGVKAFAAGSHVGCFLIFTLVTKTPLSSSEVFHGQAVVRLSDHTEQLFDGRNTRVSIDALQMQKYVAPLEDTSGASILSLNEALHRKVEGTLSFVLSVPPHTRTMTGWIFKESGRLLSNEFKKRFFVLHDNKLWYSHSDSELGNVKKSIQCREVTALVREKHKGRDCLRLHFTTLADQKKSSWLLYFPEEPAQSGSEARGDGPGPGPVQREWIRKLHRCCKALGSQDLTPGKNHGRKTQAVKEVGGRFQLLRKLTKPKNLEHAGAMAV